MASQRKALRDWLYLFIIGTQLFGMLALDLVAFYPKALYQSPSSPLHFLLSLRSWYVSSSGDPFFAQDSHQPWFEIFLYIEGLVQLPLAAYLVSQLASSKATSGPAELAGLAFGSVTFMGSAACCFELLHMGDDMVSADKKASLLYGTYLPFVVIPALLAVDMYLRLLPRVRQSESKAKTQ
ncbi:transmembrane protein 6/97 [Trichoderma barbatum]